MTGKLIAVANMKGGVGKTTTVVSLAEALAADDPSASVLVVDLDPQASAAVCLAGESLLEKMIKDGRTVEAFLEDRLIRKAKAQLTPNIHKAVCSTWHGGNQLKISLLPCGPELRIVEREIVYSLTKKKYNTNAIEGQTWKLFETEFLPLNLEYDYVIFDCPPGISPLSEVAIRASDLVVVPTIPDFISIYGINGLLRVFWRATKGALPPPKLKPHVLVTMFQRSFKQHKLKVEHSFRNTVNLEKARGLWRETGEASFTLVLAGLTEKQTLGLAKRLDKDNPDLISARLDQLRQRIADLARGTAEPVFKNILEYSSMKVTRNMSRKPK